MASIPTTGGSGDTQSTRVPAKTIWWNGLLAAFIVFLVLYAAGYAFGLYHSLRFRDPSVILDGAWGSHLRLFALAGGLVAGTLVAAWRLINRERGEANWTSALIILAVFLFGLLVWPTPWTYHEFGCKVFQINRFVGRATEVTRLPACEPEKSEVVIRN
jgi:hypothetical protein